MPAPSCVNRLPFLMSKKREAVQCEGRAFRMKADRAPDDCAIERTAKRG